MLKVLRDGMIVMKDLQYECFFSFVCKRFNIFFIQGVVFLFESEVDIFLVIKFVIEFQFDVVVCGGGYFYWDVFLFDGGLVIDFFKMNKVMVDVGIKMVVV